MSPSHYQLFFFCKFDTNFQLNSFLLAGVITEQICDILSYKTFPYFGTRRVKKKKKKCLRSTPKNAYIFLFFKQILTPVFHFFYFSSRIYRLKETRKFPRILQHSTKDARKKKKEKFLRVKKKKELTFSLKKIVFANLFIFSHFPLSLSIFKKRQRVICEKTNGLS